MKKLTVWLLLCGMLLAMLAGCVEKAPEQQGSTETDENGSVVEEESYWMNPDLKLDKVDLNLKDVEVVILSYNEYDIAPEESSSDPLEDAVYRRDDKLENELGIEFNCAYQSDYNLISTAVKNDVTAGTGEYHIVYQHMIDAARALAPGGYLYNLTDLEYVDFDSEWWDQDCKKGFVIGDSMMMVCGDLLPSAMLITAAVLFNKNQFEENGWEFPYDDAREGKWTLDDMLEMTKDQTKDLNGDGKIVYTDDYFGVTAWAADADFNLFFGTGATMFSYDADHLPVFDPDTDRLQQIYDKIYKLIITQNSFHVTWAQYDKDPGMYTATIDVFRDGRALFFPTYLSTATSLRDMVDDYGVLPNPKYDEKQVDYLGFVNGSASMACVPSSLSDENLAVAGYMLEALASSSYTMVTDTLYEKVAKSKNARDPESAQMVDIIIRHKVFDFGYSHFSGQDFPCFNIAQTALQSGKTSIVKDITTSERRTRTELKKILKAYGYDD
ncbi:MAG: extracellular solute-binding protein [Clostridia bacterium]|nr:extracellular solute-binding protein [Clostridia bacterium]